MLSHLYIRDFTLVQNLELAFGPGLTVLTGETGAGKSVLIDALALALGERADSDVIRQGVQQTEIGAMFNLEPSHTAAHWLKEQDLYSDGECVLRRVLVRDKSSKGFINGRPVPMQLLRELGELLVDIHGQHEHQSLLKRDGQREIVDAYAGLDAAVHTLGNHYTQLKALETLLSSLRQQSADRESRLELLRYQVKELETVDMQRDELAQLDEEHARLANGAELLAGTQAAAQALYDDEEASATTLLTRTMNQLVHLSRHDPRLSHLAALLNEAIINVDETATQLHHYTSSLELDPQRLQWIDERLASLHALARKHRLKPEELPELLQRMRIELSDIEDVDANLEKLESDIEKERSAYAEVADTITRQRTKASKALEQKVTAQMQELGMSGGRFEIRLTPLEQNTLGPHGRERIEYLVSANFGQDAKPLTKVASGGELSRISLALHVTAAGAGHIPSLIFDEVDVGIGGRIAEIVGQKLRTLGESRQVLCITHLAQVAALGDQHLTATKRNIKTGAHIQVQALAAAERVQEIARMIGGVKISQQTLAHAEDMLSRATV